MKNVGHKLQNKQNNENDFFLRNEDQKLIFFDRMYECMKIVAFVASIIKVKVCII